MIPTLETERLVLRAPTQGDFPVYRAFYADGEASAFYNGPLTEGAVWRKLAARALTLKRGGRIIDRSEFPDGLSRDIFEFPRPADGEADRQATQKENI